jgi:hypothetical protein
MFSFLLDVLRRLSARSRGAVQSEHYASGDVARPDDPSLEGQYDAKADSVEGRISRNRLLAKRASEAAGRGRRQK